LIELCSDDDERVRCAAVEHLSFFDRERNSAVLLQALRNDTPRVRAAAAKSLANTDRDTVVTWLRDALNDDDSWVRYFAARSLGQHRNGESVELLAWLAQTDKWSHVRIAALDALGNIGGERAVEVAVQLVKNENTDLARAALAVLGNAPGGGALSVLIESSRSVNADIRLGAVAALAEQRGPEVVEHLHRLAATDPDSAVVHKAIAGLSKLATPDAVAGLVGLLAAPTRRDAAIAAIADLEEEKLENVARGLSDPDVEVRRGVVSALTRMKWPRATEFLTIALRDKDAAVRLAATRALSRRRRIYK
jgi:HEAT repeat protein